MKKTYQIFELRYIEVCVPSTDYYSRNGDFQTTDVKTLVFLDSYDSFDVAEQAIVDLDDKLEYTILQVYSK